MGWKQPATAKNRLDMTIIDPHIQQIVDAIDTVDTSIEEVEGDNPSRPQPAVVKAGEDYYYYYYYYDDDESSSDEDA